MAKPKPKSSVESPAKARPSPVDWPAVLRSGEAGVRRWNRLNVAGRKAVDLSGVDLSGVDLSGGDFRGIRGAKASFSGANLSGADLSGADLRGVDFSAASLEGAILGDAFFDKETKWPGGFAIPGEMTWAGRATDPRFQGRGKKAVATDINGLMARLNGLIDPKRMKRTLDMLKSGQNQIFAEVEPNLVRGIVRSQKDEDLVYSCVLTVEGTYSCGTPDLAQCMGLAGEPCKHLLVLLLGLARAGELDPAIADRWIVAVAGKGPKWNKTTRNHVSETLIRYKGFQAGEVDWRPTETIPEDFYAL